MLKHVERSKICYLRVSIVNEFNEKASTVSLVTDYVVFNLQKVGDTFWEKSAAVQKTGNF